MSENAPEATEPAQEPAPTEQQPTDQEPTEGTDWKAEAQKWERMTKAERRKHDDDRQQAAEQARNDLTQSIGKALGLVPDGEQIDPERLTAELEGARGQARATQVENAVLRTSLRLGADADRLTDSRSFMDSVAKLDPSAEDFSSRVEDAITTALTTNPALRVGKAPAQQQDVSGLRPGASPNEGSGDDEYLRYFPDPQR